MTVGVIGGASGAKKCTESIEKTCVKFKTVTASNAKN